MGRTMKACRSGFVTVVVVLALAFVPVAPAQERPPTTAPARSAQTFKAADFPLRKNGETGKLAEWLKPFDRKPETFEYSIEPAGESELIRFYRLTFPSPFKSEWPENNIVYGELYLPRQVEGKVPGAVVLDILDGSAILPRGLARGMAEQGVAAMYITQPCYGKRKPPGNAHMKAFKADPNKTVDNIRQTVMDVRRAKAVLATLPEVDPKRLALTGVSLGGIMTSLAAGVDGEFARVVPILAGGDLTAITFHARETRSIRRAIEEKGMTREDTARLLAPVEPLNFAGRIDPDTCLMINAAKDEVIPRSTTEALNKAIGSRIIWTPLGHYSSILYLPQIRQRTIDFILGKQVEDLPR
jgi:cephalosporin-C deacetylase-like acetyl esterase